jgi:hypothetical protein
LVDFVKQNLDPLVFGMLPDKLSRPIRAGIIYNVNSFYLRANFCQDLKNVVGHPKRRYHYGNRYHVSPLSRLIQLYRLTSTSLTLGY